MEPSTVMFFLQTGVTIVVGIVAWSVKGTISDLKKGDQANAEKIESNAKKQEEAVEAVKKELGELKSDLPLVYVLREDYIRCEQNQERKMNSIEDKLDRLLSRG